MFRKLLAVTAVTCAFGASAVAQDWPLTLTAIAPMPTAPASTSVATPAWYPPKCRGIDYCAAVDHVIWAGPRDGRAAQVMFTSLHGTATMQPGFAVHESRDHRMHVCMQFDSFGGLEVTCLLVPAS